MRSAVPPTTSWSRPARVVATLLLVPYLAALVIAPLAGPPPATALAQAILQPFRPLLGALHLGHGYRFFAPDPGPGHAIRWEATLPDGSTRTGSIPDRDADWPRLLYHRRFMVAEKIAPLVPPAEAPADVRRQAKAEWLPLVKGVAGNLLRATGGAEVKLELVECYLPAPEEVLRGESGADIVTPLGTFAWPEGRGP